MKLKLLLIVLLMANAASATKPTTEDVGPNERKAILSLRYSSSAPEAANKSNFLKNLERDCNGFAYSNRDFDLSSEAITESYPREYVQKILIQEALHLCPRSVALIFTKSSIPLEIRKDIARTYVTRYQGSQNWPHGYLAEMQTLFDTLANTCTSKDIAAFESLFCRYTRQTGNDAGWREVYLNNFQDKCKTFARSSLSCRLNP